MLIRFIYELLSEKKEIACTHSMARYAGCLHQRIFRDRESEQGEIEVYKVLDLGRLAA